LARVIRVDRIVDLDAVPPPDSMLARGGAESRTPQSLNHNGIAFIIPVKDEAQYRICLRYIDALQIPSGYTVEKIAVFGGSSMAEVYQRAMESSTARYKIYVHVDVYLVHRGLLPELLSLFKMYPRLAMVAVSGATRVPPRVLISVNNAFHCYGRHWDYRRPGGPSALLGPLNLRRLHFSRFRSFVGDYLPAVAVDGFFMATQFDIPWMHPVFGFDLYDQVQCLEYMKLGLEVGIARQESIWCVHWGPLEEFSQEQQRRRQSGLRRKAGVFRQLYPAFIGVPARRLYQQHWGAAERWTANQRTEHLGVVIAESGGPEAVLRTLRALLPQCEALEDLGYQVVVVDNTSTASLAEAIRRESAKVTVTTGASNGGLAGAFNVGLRELGFPSFLLVMRDDTELSAGTLARMVSYLREHPSTAGVVASRIDPDGAIVGTTRALVRGEVFFDVGLYDNRFSSCHEDRDWSMRAKRKGYTFAYLPEARVHHHHRNEPRRLGPARFAERAVDDLWLTYKHAGRRWAVLLYWVQWMRARWLALRWRHDRDALHQIGEAMAQATDLYRRFSEENRRPQLL